MHRTYSMSFKLFLQRHISLPNRQGLPLSEYFPDEVPLPHHSLLTNCITIKASFTSLDKLLVPFVIGTIGYAIFTAELCDALFTTDSFHHN